MVYIKTKNKDLNEKKEKVGKKPRIIQTMTDSKKLSNTFFIPKHTKKNSYGLKVSVQARDIATQLNLIP